MTENFATQRIKKPGKERVGKSQLLLRAPVKWDEFTAYFTGYLLGDGCLSAPRVCGSHKDGTPYYREGSIKVVSIDKDIIEKLANGLWWTRPLTAHKNQWVLHFTSTGWYEFLYNVGLRPRKSFVGGNIAYPEDENFRHFIRGLFDSDGSVMSHHPGIPRLFLGGHPSYIHQINGSLRWFEHTNGNVLELWLYEKRKVYEFYDFLYKDVTIYMSRKKLKFEELCQ